MSIRRLAGLQRSLAVASFAALLIGSFDAAAQLIISEFRTRGPSGANDEYVVIHNNSGAPHTVSAASGTGYGLAASDGVTRCSIPNGTLIPRDGAYLCVNSVGYSLASYPAGNGTTATGDATFTTDIPDNAGIALFNNNTGGASYSLANRMDAVGSTAEANVLYKEGTGYPALVPFSIDSAFVRDLCGKGGSITTLAACSSGATYRDTNNNAADLVFVDTNGTSAGAGQRLGAPGPRNLSSPIGGGGAGMGVALLDTCGTFDAPPNRVRDFTSDPPNNSTFGTLDHRVTVTNSTGGNVTRLRWRIMDLTTFPAPSGFADLRPRNSTAVVVTVDRPPCGSGTSNVTVQGTTLEQPPSQPNGGGFNSSLSSGTVTLATPLANGASLDLRFLLGIQQTGTYKLGLVVETLPAGSTIYYVEGCTEAPGPAPCGGPPTVSSIVRASANPTNAASVTYTVTFSTNVNGVDASDFVLTTTGTIAGASVTGVTGSGTTRTVTVNTGTGSGTIRLDVNDDDTIVGTVGSVPLGGSGAGNGNFTTGEVYTIDKVAPTVTINQGSTQADPTAASPVVFDVVFSEAVTGFTGADISFTGSTVGGTLAPVVSGSGATYTVSVTGMTGTGTVVASIPAAATTDAAGNTSLASTSSDNTVTFDNNAPAVTINQAAGQADPTLASPILFTVVFSKTVTGFTGTDVSFAGSTVGGTLVAGVTGSGANYTVSVTGMTGNGTVVASIPAAAATDAVSNPSLASTSTDNTVTFNTAGVTTFTAPTATGSGTATASFTGGGITCSYTMSQFIGAPPGTAPVPPSVPSSFITFPHGLFNFTTSGCTAGASLTFTITYPQALPAGTQYWKYGPTAAQPAAHWYVLPATIVGNTATFTIVDGGLGDDDLTANGTIVDQGGPGVPGPAVPATPVPTLSEWMMVLMATLLLIVGMRRIRRR